MTRNFLLAIAGLILLLTGALPAAATTMTYDVTFSGDNFPEMGGPNFGPIQSVQGRFTLTIDPSQNSSGTAGLVVDSLTIPLGSSFGFVYSSAFDVLKVGGTDNGPDAIGPGTDDVLLTIRDFTTNPDLSDFFYTRTFNGALYMALVRSITVQASVATTPLPAALPLFIAALGGLGFFGWRRHQARAA